MNPKYTVGLILLAGLLFACEQKPRDEWPVVIMEECTSADAKLLEKMKVRCQPARELEPKAYATWRLQWCQELPSKPERAEEWMATCKNIYDRQMENIQAIEEGRPMPYPPPTKAELRMRLLKSCNKMNEALIKRGRDAKELLECNDIFRQE